MKPHLNATRRWLSPIFAFFVFLFASATAGLGQDAKSLAEKRAQLEGIISKFMSANSVPGLSVSIVQDGQFQWAEGFGTADMEAFVPATSRTLYRLASVSKPLTATAAMQLWERGKLDLDAPVQKYCPAFPQKERPITTRELLGHLGGIRHYRTDSDDDPEIANTKHFTDPIKDGLKLFANDPLVAKPGTEFHYSTHGYTLVGCVIEGASADKYVDYMRNSIFLSAGMLSTQVDDRYAVIPNRTRFYHKDSSGRVVNADFLDSSYKIPGGGWLSSAEDLARFEVAMLNDKLLSRQTRNIVWTSQKTADGSTTGYGLGWFLGSEGGTVKLGYPNHGGAQQGTSTFILIAPSQRAGVVVLINLDDIDPSGLASELLTSVLSKP